MNPSQVHSSLAAGQVRALMLTSAADVEGYADLARLGINISDQFAAEASAMDAAPDLQPNTFAATMGVPAQFLQAWLPGLVQVLTAARKIDELIGIDTVGRWHDEEVIQGVMEPTGLAVPYTDYGNIPLASYNLGYERRTIVRFEKGLRVGRLESARASAIQVDAAARKRNAAANALGWARNRVGFYGYNASVNRTYGFLNDPSLPAYVTVPNGAGGSPLWSNKTYLEIIADIRAALAALRTASGDNIDPKTTPITLAIASAVVDFLGVTSIYGQSVQDWLTSTYPRVRVVSAPELNAANGGANVFYVYADRVPNDGSDDDGRTWAQIVPTQFMPLGTEQQAKAYIEDFTNATAGVLLKRPFAVIRRSGI